MARKFLKRTLVLFLGTLILNSCQKSEEKKWKVAFSQCVGNDAWREQMLSEMELELIFHENIELIYTDAHADSKTQIAQIDSLLNAGIDLLIVSPNESDPLTPVVDKVYDLGIPVVLVDRKTASDKYSTFIGADNWSVGFLAGQKASALLQDNARVLEVSGLRGSSPAIERHLGFEAALANYANVTSHKLVYGDWLGDTAFARLSQQKLVPDSFDIVFAHNDVMARGSVEYFNKRIHPHLKFIGVDGLAGENLGLELVQEHILSATILYPTGGREAIKVASKILAGIEISKEMVLSSTIIDQSNASILMQQAETIKNQRITTAQLQTKIREQLAFSRSQETLLYALAAALLVMLVLLIFLIRSNRKGNAQNQLIERQNHELELANKTKNKFFSVIAHDLKSPLSSLKSFSDLFLRNYKKMNEETVISKFQRLNQSLANTIKLTENMISWAQLEMNLSQSEDEQFLLNDCVENTVRLIEPIAEVKGISLKCRFEDFVTLRADRNQMEFVIRNLLTNAVKYTNQGGFVEIGVSVNDKDEAVVKVFDNGVGMHPTVIQKLGTLEKITSSLGTSGEMGTGLGLLLCSEFAKRNNGRLVFESEIGKGTEVQFMIKNKE